MAAMMVPCVPCSDKCAIGTNQNEMPMRLQKRQRKKWESEQKLTAVDIAATTANCEQISRTFISTSRPSPTWSSETCSRYRWLALTTCMRV